jgi:hypothetical protein
MLLFSLLRSDIEAKRSQRDAEANQVVGYLKRELLPISLADNDQSMMKGECDGYPVSCCRSGICGPVGAAENRL